MTTTDLAIRLGTALAVGIVLGLEREKRGRAAGLRTTTLVCLGSALAMVLSEWLPTVNAPPGGFGGDPARLAAGVLTGMGFLGAGVILRQDTLIRGVTTAAVLWFACILGLCAGSGQPLLAVTGLGLALLVLLGLPLVEKRMTNDGYVTLTVVLAAPGLPSGTLEALLQRHHLTPLTTSFARDGERLTIAVHLTAPERDSIELPARITAELMALPGVRSTDWAG